MRRLKRLVPGHDFRDEISVVPRYSTPSTDLMAHDELFGELPAILDPNSTIGLGMNLKGDWLPEETTNFEPYVEPYSPPTPPPEPMSLAPFIARAKSQQNVPQRVYSVEDFEVETQMQEPEFELYVRPRWTDRMKGKMKRIKAKQQARIREIESVPDVAENIAEATAQPVPISAIEGANMIREVARATKVLKPLDALGDLYPSLLGLVLVAETVLVGFAMYEVYVIADGIVQTVRAIILPLLLVAKLFNIR